jgi:hypothetical protein
MRLPLLFVLAGGSSFESYGLQSIVMVYGIEP